MAHWREDAQCMRQHGVSGFSDPTTSVPSNFRYVGEVSDRDGACQPVSQPDAPAGR
jgi:hypothetical protein